MYKPIQYFFTSSEGFSTTSLYHDWTTFVQESTVSLFVQNFVHTLPKALKTLEFFFIFNARYQSLHMQYQQALGPGQKYNGQ